MSRNFKFSVLGYMWLLFRFITNFTCSCLTKKGNRYFLITFMSYAPELKPRTWSSWRCRSSFSFNFFREREDIMKGFATYVTGACFLRCFAWMYLHMAGQVILSREGFSTFYTLFHDCVLLCRFKISAEAKALSQVSQIWGKWSVCARRTYRFKLMNDVNTRRHSPQEKLQELSKFCTSTRLNKASSCHSFKNPSLSLSHKLEIRSLIPVFSYNEQVIFE